MASYRIVCTDQEPVTQPTSHAHVVRVGTGTDPTKTDRIWTLNEVLIAMNQGDDFFTKGYTSGKVARVERYDCSVCGRPRIRSTADAVPDNNLDNLRRCT